MYSFFLLLNLNFRKKINAQSKFLEVQIDLLMKSYLSLYKETQENISGWSYNLNRSYFNRTNQQLLRNLHLKKTNSLSSFNLRQFLYCKVMRFF